MTELGFSGSLASVKVYDDALDAAQVKEASGAVVITGQITSGGSAVAGATVYYKLSANAAVNPLGSVTADGSGNYTIPALQNTGPWYIAATKRGYEVSADYAPAPSVTTTDLTGKNIASTRFLPPRYPAK